MTSNLRTAAAQTALLLTLSGCMPGAGTNADPLCRAAMESLPRFQQRERHCVSVPAGVVIGRQDEAAGIAPLLSEAQEEYARYFGKTPPRLIFFVGNSVPEGLSREAEAFKVLVFNWPTMKGQRKAFVKAMRNEVDATFAQAPKKTREALLEKMVTGFENNISDSGRPSPFEGGTIRHELGHQWFMALYDASLPSTSRMTPQKSQYGSSAPDWLDEAGAILMENDYLTDMRRKQFLNMAAAVPTIRDLTTRRHPVAERSGVKGSVADGNITIRAQIHDRRVSRDITRDSAWFYAMTRGFLDFLISQSGDERIISSIAEELEKGGDLETWLSRYSHRALLGDTFEGMEEQWRAWVDRAPSG